MLRTHQPRDQTLSPKLHRDYLRLDTSLNSRASAPQRRTGPTSPPGHHFEQSSLISQRPPHQRPETGHLNLDIPSQSTPYPHRHPPRLAAHLHGRRHRQSREPPHSTASSRPHHQRQAPDGEATAPSKQHLRASSPTAPFPPPAQPPSPPAANLRGFIPDRNCSSKALAPRRSPQNPGQLPAQRTCLLAPATRPTAQASFYGPTPLGAHHGLVRLIRQQLRPQPQSQLRLRRHPIFLLLLVDHPAIYENNHIHHQLRGTLRAPKPLPKHHPLIWRRSRRLTTSTHLPRQHTRNQGAADANLQPHSTTPTLLSLGAGNRDEISPGARRGNDNVFLVPSGAADYTLHHTVRLERAGPASAMPTLRRPYVLRPHHHRQPQTSTEFRLELRSRSRMDPPTAASPSTPAASVSRKKDASRLRQDHPATTALPTPKPWQAINNTELKHHRSRSHRPPPITNNRQLSSAHRRPRSTHQPTSSTSTPMNYAAQNPPY